MRGFTVINVEHWLRILGSQIFTLSAKGSLRYFRKQKLRIRIKISLLNNPNQ